MQHLLTRTSRSKFCVTVGRKEKKHWQCQDNQDIKCKDADTKRTPPNSTEVATNCVRNLYTRSHTILPCSRERLINKLRIFIRQIEQKASVPERKIDQNNLRSEIHLSTLNHHRSYASNITETYISQVNNILMHPTEKDTPRKKTHKPHNLISTRMQILCNSFVKQIKDTKPNCT